MERCSSRSNFKEISSNSSSENILKIDEQQTNKMKTKTFKQFTETTELQRSSTITVKTVQNVPPAANSTTTTAQRKKRLQKQKSIVYSGDEAEYAADLEEEGDDDEDEGYGHNEREININLPAAASLASSKKKQVRFRNKQQSESSLKLMSSQHHTPIEKTFSSSSLTSALNSMGTSCSVSNYERRLRSDGSFDSIPELPHGSDDGLLQRQKRILKRDSSIHSDSSRYSSVDSLLEARKPNPEAILINLGFGPVGSEDILSRIPKRFLKPSQVRGIDTEAFIKRLQLANTLADHSVLGYRGLTGNPDVPPSHIVAKIMERFEVNERKKSLTSMELKLR